jgi:hypothetical protein
VGTFPGCVVGKPKTEIRMPANFRVARHSQCEMDEIPNSILLPVAQPPPAGHAGAATDRFMWWTDKEK